MRVRLSGDPETVAGLRAMLERSARGVVCVEGRADYVLDLRLGGLWFQTEAGARTIATLDGIHSTFESTLAQQLTDQRAVPPGFRELLICMAPKPAACEGEVRFASEHRDVVVRACYRALMAHAGREPKPRWWQFKPWALILLAAFVTACAPIVRVEAPRPLPDFAKALALKCMGEAIALDVYMAGFPLMHSTERIEMLAALELSTCSPEAIAYRRARQQPPAQAPPPTPTPKGME